MCDRLQLDPWRLCTGIVVATFAMNAAYCEESLYRFGTASAKNPLWEQRFSPTANHFAITEDAWRIDYRPQGSKPMPTGGIRSAFTVDGGFEIQTVFRIDDISPPASGPGAGILLRLPFHDDTQTIALAHVRATDGKWIAYVTMKDGSPGGNHYHRLELDGPVTRLKLTREGNVYSFHAGTAEEAESLFHSRAGPAGMPDCIQLWATSGNAPATIRAEVHSISVSAEKIDVTEEMPRVQTAAPITANTVKEKDAESSSDRHRVIETGIETQWPGLLALFRRYPTTLTFMVILLIATAARSAPARLLHPRGDAALTRATEEGGR